MNQLYITESGHNTNQGGFKMKSKYIVLMIAMLFAASFMLTGCGSDDDAGVGGGSSIATSGGGSGLEKSG